MLNFISKADKSGNKYIIRVFQAEKIYKFELFCSIPMFNYAEVSNKTDLNNIEMMLLRDGYKREV